MCYCPTPTLHLNLALTGDGAFLFSPQKTHSVWFISVLNYGDTENVLINHLLLVIPMSYPCHYTNLCPHKPHKHAHTHTHTHTHTHPHTHSHTYACMHAHSLTHACIHTRGVRWYLDIFAITIIGRYFAECVIVLISDYRGQLQFLIFVIFCLNSSHQW